MLGSLVVRAKRSVAAPLVTDWPTKPVRPLRLWRMLSAPAIRAAWMAMVSEALTGGQCLEASTAWLAMGRVARHCPRLPPFSLLAKASMEAVLGYSMAPRQSRTLLQPLRGSEEACLLVVAVEVAFLRRLAAGQVLPALQRPELATGSTPPPSWQRASPGFLPSVTSSRS